MSRNNYGVTVLNHTLVWITRTHKQSSFLNVRNIHCPNKVILCLFILICAAKEFFMKEIIKKRVLEIVNSNLEYEKITMEQCEDDLLEYGMDSIRFIQTIVSLEEEFECEVPDSKLLLVEMNTINKIYEVLISIDSNESNIVY